MALTAFAFWILDRLIKSVQLNYFSLRLWVSKFGETITVKLVGNSFDLLQESLDMGNPYQFQLRLVLLSEWHVCQVWGYVPFTSL